MRHAGLGVAIAGALALIIFSIWFQPVGPTPELPDRLRFEAASFDDLPGWADADLAPALTAFQRSCDLFRRRALASSEDPNGASWVEACAAADSAMVAAMNMETIARNFFSAGFTPLRILNNDETTGLFTGYYEPELRGSLTPTDEFSTPLLARPEDLVMVNLSEFPGELTGRIAGRVIAGQLRPFEDRGAIETGALPDALPLVWIDDPVDAFFLHIQGSGRVVLDDGTVMRVGYAGQNGHPYTAIGRLLVQRGEMTVEEASMQSIRDWLAAHPVQGEALMRENASYVFFREIEVADPNLGAIGAAGVPLTPGYSLAVDLNFHALGAPAFVATDLADGTPFQRLMVLQDTGGAIRGPIRGDIFFGFGEDAGALAGPQRSDGALWVLVPNDVAARLAALETALEAVE
jgi:membrane-bound lytic murein transglycosylase A